LKLTMAVDFSAQYVKGDELWSLAEGTLNAAIPEGYDAVTESLAYRLTRPPTADASGNMHFELQAERQLLRKVNLARANVLVLGKSPAESALQEQLLLAAPPEIGKPAGGRGSGGPVRSAVTSQ
jgi:hypothetical protein